MSSAQMLVFGLCLALIIAAATQGLSGGWGDNLRRRCVEQGGQVIEMVSRLQTGCLLPQWVERLAESP